jgi:exopolysaccharide biosynthesis operon protein EpsL
VFRLPGNVSAQSAVGVPFRSDTISVTQVGLSFDRNYAQQRFQLDLTETAYRYANATSLNFEAFEYRGAWHWHLTPRWSGVISSERRVSMASLADTQFSQRTQRNLRTADNLHLTMDGSLTGGWHVVMGAFEYQLKYDQGFAPQNSSRLRGLEAGVKYESRARNALTLVKRAIQGDYLDRIPDEVSFNDSGFRQNDVELRLDWSLSGKSQLRGRLTWIDVKHQHFAVRNFSGLAWEGLYVWVPTGKLRIETLIRRDVSPWWQTYSSYRLDDTFSLSPVWQISAKTALRVRLERIRTDFRGPLPANSQGERGDTLHTAQVGVDWYPLPSLTVDAGLQHQWRSSNFPGVGFNTNMATLNAKLKF